MNLWFPESVLDLTLCLWPEDGGAKRGKQTQGINVAQNEET